jgi:CMP-N,N'-diacetyllegionaminic acid synthase
VTTIATICARGGSKGVPGKNIRQLHGKPLIAHTIAQAHACKFIDRVFVSTDDHDIAKAARIAGAEVPFLRPAELATDTAPKIPVIRHLVNEVKQMGVAVDRIVDLDPTSPLRDVADIEACLSLLDAETDAVITAYPAEKNPYFNMVEAQKSGGYNLSKSLPAAIIRRQDAPQVYSMNASIYVWWERTLDNHLFGPRTELHVMPRERSIDIDSEIDFLLVEMLMSRKTRA